MNDSAKMSYELNGVSVAFVCPSALGDSIIAKKVFEAIITLESNCHIDILCADGKSLAYAKAFYSDNKNLNSIVFLSNTNGIDLRKYDLALQVEHTVMLLSANLERLRNLSPALFQSVIKIDNYNKRHMYNKDFSGRVLFHMARSRILKTNRYTSLSCDGALPIYDNHVEINLSPDWQAEFDKLKLKKYITVGSNGGQFNRHLVKEWITRYYVEFILLLKAHMPEIEVVQTGGGGLFHLKMLTDICSEQTWNSRNTY